MSAVLGFSVAGSGEVIFQSALHGSETERRQAQVIDSVDDPWRAPPSFGPLHWRQQ
jgi:hypothetical protein